MRDGFALADSTKIRDRSCWTVPVPETWSNPDGYWESKSNLTKALALEEMLKKAGATVIMSRTTNKSGERDIEEYPNATKGSPLYNELMKGDDRDLGAIGREASDNDVDHFLSIHSNALNGGRLNYLLMLYRGYNDEPKVPESDEMAKSGAASQIKNELTVWSASEPKIYGDITFYGEEHGGLGVLKLLTVPGFLSEGSFHDYAPETHRLMNKDYCKLEALRMFQHFHKWFEAPLPQTATISGWVKSGNELVDVLGDKLYYDGKLKYVYVKNSDDQWLPINGAKVELYKGETLVNTYITDDWYNGIFAFYDLEPGTYKVVVTYKNYSTYTQEVTVKAEEIAQVKARINNLRLTLPDYPESKADISAIDDYKFEPVGRKVDAPKNLVRAIYRNNKYFILADGKLTQYDIDFSNPTSITMPADVEICDFGFTADSYLVAKVKDQGKFYTWDENNDNPVELFTVSDIKGNSFAVSGARWESKYYLAEEKTIYQVAYDEDKKTAKVVTKTNKKDLTGKQLTIMPNGEISSVDGASFINYDHVYMAKPGNGMSFQLFDVNDGVEKAKAVSAVYPEGTTDTSQPVAATMAWVDEYTIHVVIVAEGFGMQHFQTVSTPVANIYASEVYFDETAFNFRLNDNATDVILTLEKDNQEVASKSLGALKKGAHSIANPFGGTDFDYFSITATAQPVAFPTKISNDDKIFQFYAARGVAVDKTPESPYFGRIYVTNSLGGQCGEEGSAPAKSYRNSSMGVFVLSSDFKDITKQGNEGWLGDVAWGENKLNTSAGIYQFPLSRPAVAPDGDVFIASTALTSAGVYIMNPAEPAAPFVQLFDGPRRNKDNGQIMAKNKKAIANPVMHCCILGTGKDEVLYTLDRDASKGTIYTSINQYNIGEATEFPWTTEPSAIFYDDEIDEVMQFIDFLYDKFINNYSIRKKTNSKKLLISEYSINLNDKFKDSGFDPVIGRDSQVNRLIEILLRRTKNNPVLVGEAGVGKTAIVEELVRRIELGNVPRKLLNVRVYSLSLASLIAGTKYRGEFEERINQIISEIESDQNVVIFIDEIHTLVGAGGAEGAIDASNILKPYLARGVIRVIGATTKDEYVKYIENDKALDRRFQKINVLEMSLDETMNILFNIRSLYENYHGVVISDEIIKSIVILSERYIHNGKFPDKAIDVFDEVCAKTAIIDDDFDKKIKVVSSKIDVIKSKKNSLIMEHKFKEAESVRKKQLILESELNSIYYDIDNRNNAKEVTIESLYQVIYDRTKIPINTIVGFNKDYVYENIVKEIIFNLLSGEITLPILPQPNEIV